MTNALKTAEKVAYNIVKWVPPINLLRYMSNGQIEDRRNGKSDGSIILKGFGHLAYTMVTGCALALWGMGVYETGEVNPVTQRQVILQRIEDAEQEQRDYQRELSNLNDKLFGVDGLADTNHDGKVNVVERAEAYRRMGLEEQVQFPNTNKDDLEKAVRSYEPSKPTEAKSTSIGEQVREMFKSNPGHPLPGLYDNPEFQKHVNPHLYKGEKK